MSCNKVIQCNCSQPCDCVKTCNPCDPCNKDNPCDSCKKEGSCNKCSKGKKCNTCEDKAPDCACEVKNLSTNCIVYTGDDLSCTGIKKGNLLTDVIAQMNCFICTKYDQMLKYFNIINVGGGAEIYAGVDGIGQKKLRTLISGDDIVVVKQNEEDISISVDKEGIQGIVLDYLQNNPNIICELIENNCVPEPENIPPTVEAGENQIIQLPTNNTTVTAIGNDIDGTVVSYQWIKISGGNATISSPNSPTTTITGLTQGAYVFQVTVTDNEGAIGTDTIVITILAAGAVNQPPIANAGTNQAITLPTSTVGLDGTLSTDIDGVIVDYSWVQTLGPLSTIVSPNSATTNVTGLTVGTFVYELTVTDNEGATDTSTVIITVSAENIPPTVDAGENQDITEDSTSVTAVATDIDGTIISYSWTQISGGSGAVVDIPNSPTTTLSNLTVGTYVFQVTVIDNNGAMATDIVTIVVQNSNTLATHQIIQAKCNTNLTGLIWTDIYLSGLPIGNGTIVYTDSQLTIPFNGNDLIYRIQTSNNLIFDDMYTISSTGVITNVTDCIRTPSGGNEASIILQNSDSCGSCMAVEVEVPQGETRTVTITKNGIGGYGYSSTNCLTSINPVTSNMTETISSTKTYSFGIDAASGNQQSTTTITLSVTGGNSVTLTRNHSNPVQNC